MRALTVSSCAALLVTATALPAAIGPYAVDGTTLHLYHFDETGPNANGFADAAGTVHLTNAHRPAGNGFGGAVYSSAFGNSFRVLQSGDGNYSSGSGGSSTGGGATTASGLSQISNLQGANGEFTYEAIVRPDVNFLSETTGERTILSHDGSGSSRGFSFRVYQGRLNFYNGTTAYASTTAIPTTGDHAFGVGEWYHVAVTYNGQENTADNLKFYWTKLDVEVTAANQLASANMGVDVVNFNNNLGAGTLTRSPYRMQWQGLIDEVRISDIARDADDFLVAVPEPGSFALAGAMAAVGLGRRRRRR